jgi:hypothetical protein
MNDRDIENIYDEDDFFVSIEEEIRCFIVNEKEKGISPCIQNFCMQSGYLLSDSIEEIFKLQSEEE